MIIKRIFDVMMRPSRRKRQQREKELAYQTEMRAWASTMDATEEGKTRIVADYEKMYEAKGITREEYHDFEFDRRSEEFRKTFLGLNEQRFYLDYLNPVKYYIFCRHKYFTHKILEGYDVRKSDLYCYYQPEVLHESDNDCANSLAGVLRILKKKNIQSCVVKPTEGTHGNDVWVIKAIEYGDDDAVMTRYDNEKVQLSSFLKQDALIFESIVRQTKQFASINASSVNTIRMITTLFPDGSVKIIAAILKIGRAGRCVDNAGDGGNIDAFINPETGVIVGVYNFDGWRNVKEIERHPDSGTQLKGMVIDNWQSIISDVKKFQQSFPYCKAAGWDIAITDDGPVVIEVNDMWDRVFQCFMPRGFRNGIRDCYIAWQSTGKKYYMGRLKQALWLEQLNEIVDNEWANSSYEHGTTRIVPLKESATSAK